MALGLVAVFQSQTRRLLPRNQEGLERATVARSFNRRRDACFLATPMRYAGAHRVRGFNRRRDACFLATLISPGGTPVYSLFQSQTRRLLPRNLEDYVRHAREMRRFNRRRDACFLATRGRRWKRETFPTFQSQTRRLLPRNVLSPPLESGYKAFQSQTRRLLPRNSSVARKSALMRPRFNRRRDACFLATPALWVLQLS